MRAEDLMEKDIPYYPPDAIGLTLATAMISWKCGAIPIVDEQKQIIGIVTEFDLLDALMRGEDLEKVRASEIIKIMETLHLIHIPVVDSEGQLVGLIERSDTLLAYLESRLTPSSP